MAGEQAPTGEGYFTYIQRLVERVHSEGLSGMVSEEVDALDEAIEMGVVSHDELRVRQDA